MGEGHTRPLPLGGGLGWGLNCHVCSSGWRTCWTKGFANDKPPFCRALTAFPLDLIEYAIGVSQRVVVRESKHANAETLQAGISLPIGGIAFLSLVLAAVQFDREFQIVAVEIGM